MLAYALTLGGSQSNPAPPEAYFNFIVAQPILGKKCDKEEGIHGIRARQSLDAILRFWGTTLWGKRKKKSDITFATTKRARNPPQHTRDLLHLNPRACKFPPNPPPPPPPRSNTTKPTNHVLLLLPPPLLQQRAHRKTPQPSSPQVHYYPHPPNPLNLPLHNRPFPFTRMSHCEFSSASHP